MSERISCPECGASIVSTAAFCPECGHRQATPGAGAATPSSGHIPAPPPPPGRPPTGEPPAGAPPPHFGPRPTPAKGFWAGLFDFGFTTFVTPKVIKFVYVVMTIIIGLSWIYWLYEGFHASSGLGILVLVFGPLIALFWLIVYRIMLELAMVIFRIGADVHAINERSDLE
ncbi:DUF4282 domain-containing protein [Streptomyces sp. NPDC049541]|uniref:DUF4282 domain-containing protein n=1 Tax=Streptomyces sp. NPDC049541 TaxID=3365594 RepID=UPI0037B1BBFE